MRASGDQAKTECSNLQMCAGLSAGIESATHAVGQRIVERARQISSAEEARRPDEEEDEDGVVG